MYLKVSIFIVFLFYLGSVSYASYINFDFSLNEYLVSENTETEVNFSYLLSGYENTDFVVKPYVGKGTVEVFNSEKNEWVGSFITTNLFPTLSESMIIRFQNLGVDKTHLWFEIKCLKDAKTYFTPKKNIWSNKTYDGYVEELNYSISNYENTSEEKSNEVFEVRESSKSFQDSYLGFVENIPSKFYLYFSIVLFLISAVFGFLYRRIKNKKEMIQSISESFEKLDTRNINDGSYLHPFFGSRSGGK